METKVQVDIKKLVIIPIEIIYWVGVSLVILFSLLVNKEIIVSSLLLILLVVAIAFGMMYFHFLVPRYGTKPWIIYIGAFGFITIIALFSSFIGDGIHIGALYLTVIFSVGIISGSEIALHTAFYAVFAEIVLTVLNSEKSPESMYLLGVQAVILLIAGYFISRLTGVFHEKIQTSERQNRYLSILLKVGLISSLPDDLEDTIPRIAEMITREVPVSSCQICLLNSSKDQLSILGYFKFRMHKEEKLPFGQSFSLHEFPIFSDVLENGHYRVIDDVQIKAAMNDTSGTNLLFEGLNTACFLPMQIKRGKLGIIMVGEARHKKREPFTQQKIDFLQTLTSQVAAIINNAQLFQEAQHQAKRLEAVNRVATAISSTIELENLLELIYEQLSKVTPSDTYYVGLYDSEEDVLEIHIMIDKGERFPRFSLPRDKGWARWVIQNRQPLLIRHFSTGKDQTPIEPIVIGYNQPSESWLGVPLLAGERTLGLIAIASYSPNAFDEGDKLLLSNVATQAALAVDNARQHADVKEQARRDSLTGVYNHGYLLTLLNEAIEHGKNEGTPVSLIMIDIDYFKEYNDQYGHVLGDQVLQMGIQAIQSNVKKGDIVGRWGGEEFAIVLPGATLEQAYGVAKRIQMSLASIKIFDKTGKPIPPPTLSQGIASFPQHADDIAKLVDIADMALYRAKNLGRNQIITTEES